MRKLLLHLNLILMSFLLNSPISFANASNEEQFSIYLVRHAEKVANSTVDKKNPPLTACGTKRSKQLAVILKQANIKKIYSTQTLRTEQTAAPLAKQLHLEVIPYSASDLASFAQQVKKAKTNTLIVGHSNTTPQLTALVANTPVKEITEAEYQMLYQVNFQGDNSQLTLLRQPLSCQ
ncbi:SixA phosphatase family protein [Thalassotalea profundi]|uniref:Histidine phosphatase family protein n=1 Tax=Thalassotalea profundi TaxID=2036687 RepID=A0ABQ3J380_9GAMM|nr:histidine phosphatase family protein [Thalassotalea profundi]GHF00039.1 hypothetical protein GCM10011501_31840 [Thalassotalea profundi]